MEASSAPSAGQGPARHAPRRPPLTRSLQAATPNNRTLQWHGSQWAYGADTRSPSTFLDASGVSHPAPGVSSFEAVDAAVAHYANKTRFPNIESIVVAGHSLGAQMVQRYALIGAVPSRDVPVHFVIANPSSYAYLDSVRPNSTANCASTYDAWKVSRRDASDVSSSLTPPLSSSASARTRSATSPRS